MLLRDYLLNVLFGELSGSPISKKVLPLVTGMGNSGDVPDALNDTVLDVGRLISFINLGLTDMHTRLDLRREEVFIDCVEYMDTYKLTQEYAQYAGRNILDVSPKYVSDSRSNPFTGNILEILTVSDETGETLFTNDSNAMWSVFIRNSNIIQIPYAENFVSLSIIYKANHPMLHFSVDGVFIGNDGNFVYKFYDFDEVIDIPAYMLQALNYYVACKYYTNKGSQEAIAEGNMYQQMYENALTTIRNANPIHGDYTEPATLLESGFV